MAYQSKKHRKFVATAATAALVASAVAPAAGFAAENTKNFPDLAGYSWAKEAIDHLVAKGAITGYPDGTFAPGDSIKRGEAAKLLASALKLNVDEKATANFEDTKGHWAAPFIAAIQKEKPGVIEGYNGKFRPEDSITRQELAKMIATAYDLKANPAATISFKDNTDWGKDFVQALASQGVVNGYEGGVFKPNAKVNRAETAMFVFRSEVPEKRLPVDTGVLKLVSVAPITAKTVDVTFTGDTKDLTAQNFAVSGGLSVIDVKFTSANKATVTFSTDMTDGAEYELQLLDNEDNVISKASFKYVLGEVANISLTKSKFEVGENVKNFLKVFDDKGVEISKADYNVTNVESSNTAVVEDATGTAGKVAALGTANLRFEIKYKDGSITKSDFIRIDVEQAVTAELAGFELANTASFKNTVEYRMLGGAKSSFYESDSAEYLFVYADDSKTNPEIKPLDLKAGGDYTVESKTPAVITVDQDATGAELTPISKGKATIVITGKNNYKKTLTVEVKEDPKYKDLLVGATSLKLSDESKADAVGVNKEQVLLQWVDQYGKKNNFTVSSPTVAADEIVQTGAITTGDKLVISVSQSNGAFDLTGLTAGSVLELKANQSKVVNNASIRVSYYANASDNKPTTQKVISTSVVDVDATAPAYNYQTLLSTPAIDARNVVNKNNSVVTGFALDRNGNRIADVTSDITLSFADSVTKPEQKWFDLTTTAGTVAFDAKAWKHMTESGTLKLEYTVAGSSQAHGTVNVAYDNSFKAPNKAVVNTSPVVINTKAGGDFASGISAEELLFGKILGNSGQLVIDTDSTIYGVANNASIAVKKGFTGYANNPVLSFLDKQSKAVVSGSALYGLDVSSDTTGNGYVVNTSSGAYDADTSFVVKYSITNAKDLNESAAGTLGNTFTIKGSATQASFTIVISEITVANDPRVDEKGNAKAKNLLDAPKAVNVVLSK